MERLRKEKKTQVDFKVVFHSQAKLLSQNGSRPTMIHGVVFGGVLLFFSCSKI